MANIELIKIIPELTVKDITRFKAKVDVRGPDECWPWKAGVSKKQGYGVFWAHGKSFYAHRIAFDLEKGDIPDTLLVLHHCDNTGCCNPKHLYAGTDKANALDRERRDRSHPKFGDDNPSRKHPELLKWKDTHALRLDPSRIARGDRHKSKTKPESISKGEQHPQAKLTDTQVNEIRSKRNSGATYTELMKEYGMTRASICLIVNRKTWRHLP